MKQTKNPTPLTKREKKHQHRFVWISDGVETISGPFGKLTKPEPSRVTRFKCSCGKPQIFVDVVGGDWNDKLPKVFSIK